MLKSKRRARLFSVLLMTFSVEDPRDWSIMKEYTLQWKLIESKGSQRSVFLQVFSHSEWDKHGTVQKLTVATGSVIHSNLNPKMPQTPLLEEWIKSSLMINWVTHWNCNLQLRVERGEICLSLGAQCAMLSKGGQSTVNILIAYCFWKLPYQPFSHLDCCMLHVASLNLFSLLFQSHKKCSVLLPIFHLSYMGLLHTPFHFFVCLTNLL